MRTRRGVVHGLFLLGALTACQPAPAALSEKDVSDIKAVVDRWTGAFVESKRDDLANIITKFIVTTDEITGLGDLAYVRGTYSIDVTLPDGLWAYSRLSWHSSEPLPVPAPAPAKK